MIANAAAALFATPAFAQNRQPRPVQPSAPSPLAQQALSSGDINLALNSGEGCNFKLLGVPFDNVLSMRDAVEEFVSEADWKMALIPRS